MRSANFVGDVVRLIVWFARHLGVDSEGGVFNMGGPEMLTRVQVAEAVARHRGYDTALVHAVKRADVVPPGAVASPPDISMDSSKLSAATGIAMTPLAEMVKLSF